ncbi:MAG: arsenate reductase ArsC [Verrucomicrobiota bacterium]
MDKKKILFLCTGNSARSIMAEYILRKKDPFRFESFSAGSHPKDSPHPLALKTLKDRYLIDASDARSKSWDEYRKVDFDFVLTVCDNARETCPVWPGQPIVAHWGSPDPVAAPEDKLEQVFIDVSTQIARRIDLLISLPIEKLDSLRTKIAKATADIGKQ